MVLTALSAIPLACESPSIVSIIWVSLSLRAVIAFFNVNIAGSLSESKIIGTGAYPHASISSVIFFATHGYSPVCPVAITSTFFFLLSTTTSIGFWPFFSFSRFM